LIFPDSFPALNDQKVTIFITPKQYFLGDYQELLNQISDEVTSQELAILKALDLVSLIPHESFCYKLSAPDFAPLLL